MHAILSKLPDEKKFSEITVIGGSIDIETKTAEDVATDYQAFLVTASTKAPKISICSILPRTDKNFDDITKKVNQELGKICLNEGHSFRNMDDSFHLRNGQINSAFLLSDGLHLSRHGLDSLMKGCQVNVKEGVSSVFTDSRYKRNKKEKKKEKLLFRGHESPFSNFFPVEGLVVDNISFTTTEAAYVHHKALFHHDRWTAESVKSSRTGFHAKRLGDKIRTSSAWQQKKVDVMDNLIRAKLKTSAVVWKALQETGDRELVENTKDAFWGQGNDGNGENMLGKLWMLHRKKLHLYESRPPAHRTWATRHHQPRCYRCGEPGHLLEQCRQREDIACWECGEYGHKRKHCSGSASQYGGYYR